MTFWISCDLLYIVLSIYINYMTIYIKCYDVSFLGQITSLVVFRCQYTCPQCCRWLYTGTDGCLKAINCCCHKAGQQNGRGSPTLFMVFGASEWADISRRSCWWQVAAALCSTERSSWRSCYLPERCLGGPGPVPCLYLWKACKTTLQESMRNVI